MLLCFTTLKCAGNHKSNKTYNRATVLIVVHLLLQLFVFGGRIPFNRPYNTNSQQESASFTQSDSTADGVFGVNQPRDIPNYPRNEETTAKNLAIFQGPPVSLGEAGSKMASNSTKNSLGNINWAIPGGWQTTAAVVGAIAALMLLFACGFLQMGKRR